MQKVHLRVLDNIRYKEAWDLQESILKKAVDLKIEANRTGESKAIDHHLLICSHPHVYTLGKHGDPQHLLLTEEQMKARGVDYFKINRGGDITYHGPGQMVAYPILDLEQFKPDLKYYFYSLEESIIKTIAEYGLDGSRLEGSTGVWLDPGTPRARKICALGVRCNHWVTMHGLALNVNSDLSYFGGIIPCGISDKAVTSLKQELGREIEEEEVRQIFIRKFEGIFGAEVTD